MQSDDQSVQDASTSMWWDLFWWCTLGLVVRWWLGSWTEGLIGHPFGDMPDHVWGNEWFAHELRAGRWPWLVQDNYFPDGGVLWHIDPVGGLFRRLFLFLPPHWVWNAYIWLLMWGSAVAVYSWSHRLRLSRTKSGMLALLSIFNSYVAGLVHSGLSEYMGLIFGVFLAQSLHEQRFGRAGLWLMVLGIQSFVVGVIASLFSATFLLFSTDVQFRRLSMWLKLVLPSAVVVLPMVALCWQTLHDPNAVFLPHEAPGWNFRMLPTVDLYGFFPFGDWVHPDTRHLNPGIVQNHSLGWGWISLLIIGGISVWRVGRLNEHRPFFVYGMLALGPRLSIARWMPLGGWVLLPLAILYVPGSPFRWVHHPYHMVMFLWIGSIPLVVKGIQVAPKWIWIPISAITAFDVQTGSVPVPLERTEFVEDCSVEGPRLDFPPDQSTANRQYLVQQLSHREPIAYGVNQWMSPSVFADPGMQRWLKLLDDPVRRSQNRDQPPQKIEWLHSLNEPSGLDSLGFDWLVVHLRHLSDAEQTRLTPILRDEWGEPVMKSDFQWVYSLKPQTE